jgi:hypothetical protein
MDRRDAVPERVDFALDVVVALDEIVEDRLCALCSPPRSRPASSSPPRAVSSGAFGDPSQIVTFGLRVVKSGLVRWWRAPLDRLVDQHPVGEIELEVLLVESPKLYRFVAVVCTPRSDATVPAPPSRTP